MPRDCPGAITAFDFLEAAPIGARKTRRGARTMKQIKTLCAGGLLVLALFSAAAAGPLENGQAAYQKGDYAAALQILRPLAEQGNASAQTALGVIYEHGQGVPQDFVQAVIWYNEAAYQGDPDAQTNLGAMYANGWGVPQDYAPGRRVVPPGQRAGERRCAEQPRPNVRAWPRRAAGLCQCAHVVKLGGNVTSNGSRSS
jgi:Sel1 repeat